MPRRSRLSTGRFIFHVLNRAVQGVTLFEDASDYRLVMELLAEATRSYSMRVLAFVIMPNHWHLVLQPLDDESLSPFMKWLTGTHAMRWRSMRGSQGRGAVYQGRFKAIAVQHDAHFLRLCRYVERNPVRARLVARAQDWPWSSAAQQESRTDGLVLHPWPVAKPTDWTDLLGVPEPPRTLRSIRTAIHSGRHFGSTAWRLETTDRLKWRNGLTPRGRPALTVSVTDQPA